MQTSSEIHELVTALAQARPLCPRIILSVHFDSGTTSRDHGHRWQATQRFGQIAIGNTPILQLDQDVLVLGDYNTIISAFGDSQRLKK